MLKQVKEFTNISGKEQSLQDTEYIYQTIYDEGTINTFKSEMTDILVENEIFSEGITVIEIISEGESDIGDSTFVSDKVTLGDGVLLPEDVNMLLDLFITDYSEWGKFHIASDGTVTPLNSSANIVLTDTDNKLCILPGDTPKIKNNFSAEKELFYELKY
jgi:hypothetical protein